MVWISYPVSLTLRGSSLVESVLDAFLRLSVDTGVVKTVNS